MTRARNSANLASQGNLFVDIANDRTGIGSVVPAQNLHVAGTAGFHADTTFVGDLYSTTWDRSANSLSFQDSAKIRLGSDNDASIRHDGSNMWIQNSTGYIYMDASSNAIRLISQASWASGAMAAFNNNGSVQLFYDAQQKFLTQDYGINVIGTTDTDGLVVSGVATVTTMNVTGVLTYDDVTSIDSIGIITARSNIDCNGDLDVDGHTNLDNVNIAGVTTFASAINGSGQFVWDAADADVIIRDGTDSPQNFIYRDHSASKLYLGTTSNVVELRSNLLTNADSTYDIGTNSVRWRNVYADTLYGDGSNLTGITQTTISGNANNRIITGSGTANTLNGESTFTYDGDGILSMTSTSGSAEFTIVGPNNTDSGIYFNDGSNDGALIYDHSSRQLKFRAGGHTRMYFAGGNDNNNNVVYLSNNSYDDGILQYYNGGLYLKTGSSSGDRLISFHTAGSERLHITSSGRVGINQSSPQAMLQVDYDYNSSEIGLRIRAATGSGTKTWQLSEINGNAGVFTIRNASNGYNILNIDGANQRVGINNSSPSYTLSVVGDSGGNFAASSNSTNGVLSIVGKNSSGNVSAISRIKSYPDGSSNQSHMTFETRTSSNTMVERLRITSGGKVGINLSNNTTADLQVCTPSTAHGLLRIGGNNTTGVGIDIDYSNSGHTKTTFKQNYRASQATAEMSFESGFFTFISGTGSDERLRIDSSGRLIVGGGTHAGGSALVVKGGGVNTYSTVGLFGATSTPSNNAIFAQIRFGSGTTQVGATINAKADADWGSSNDYPTRLEFYTAPDGSGTVTEKLRITSTGMVEMRSDMSAADQATRNIFRFTDTDTSTTTNQSMGRLQWFSSDASGGGACVKAEIEAVANDTTPEANLLFKTHTSSNTSPSERMRITGDGQVLIGATSSSGAIAIIQQNSSDDDFTDQQTCADSSGLRIQNYSFGAGRYTALSLECANASSVQSASIIAQSTSSGTAPNIIIAQRTSIGANTERFRIRADGTIRIGGDLYTDTSIMMTLRNRAGAGSQIQFHGTGSGTGNSDGLRVGYNGTGGQMWLFENGGYLRFATSNNERLRIHDTGAMTHFRGDNTTRYDLEFRQTGGISDGNYGGLRWSQNSTGGVGLAALEIAYTDAGRPHIVFRHRNRGGGTNLVEVMRLKNDGDVSIADGNLVIGTSGHGIDFSASGNASEMTSELLDDYEEGTFVPELKGTSGGGTLTGSTAAASGGNYTKIGNKVFLTFYFANPSGSNPSGTLYFELPHTVAGNNNSYGDGGCVTYHRNIDPSGNRIFAVNAIPSTNRLYIARVKQGGQNETVYQTISHDSNLTSMLFKAVVQYVAA